MGNRYSKRYQSFSVDIDTVAYDTGVSTRQVQRSSVSLVKERVGADDPMWRSKVSRNQSATNPLRAYRQDLVYKGGEARFHWSNVNYPSYLKPMRVSGFFTPTVPTVDEGLGNWPTLRDTAQNRAAIGIRKKIHDQSTTWSGLTFLGELRESISMIRHPAKLLRMKSVNFFHQANKTRSFKRKARESAMADLWLEYSFGVAPLIADVSAIAAATILRVQEPKVIRLSFTAQAERATSSSSSRNVAGLLASYWHDVNNVDEVSYRYLVGYRVTVPPHTYLPACHQLVALGGFNLQEILPTAWELLPWSFFVDYFTNIGDVISSSLVSLEDVVWSQSTARYVRQVDTTLHTSKCSTSGLYLKFDGGEDQTSTASCTKIVRANAEIPFPVLQFELPGSQNQFLNLAALARNNLVPKPLSRRFSL